MNDYMQASYELAADAFYERKTDVPLQQGELCDGCDKPMGADSHRWEHEEWCTRYRDSDFFADDAPYGVWYEVKYAAYALWCDECGMHSEHCSENHADLSRIEAESTPVQAIPRPQPNKEYRMSNFEIVCIVKSVCPVAETGLLNDPEPMFDDLDYCVVQDGYLFKVSTAIPGSILDSAIAATSAVEVFEDSRQVFSDMPVGAHLTLWNVMSSDNDIYPFFVGIIDPARLPRVCKIDRR